MYSISPAKLAWIEIGGAVISDLAMRSTRLQITSSSGPLYRPPCFSGDIKLVLTNAVSKPNYRNSKHGNIFMSKSPTLHQPTGIVTYLCKNSLACSNE
ncbi:hypothetical protein PoB_007233500 [Plakobranchus ocellatus]|uniref:Uncharacterized protein n=1 Tax=Plakobranchus ocellatus TaxID=259542 RepID=A0AAV4DPH8_9GAST|nr:hypothetical protein PoB_007233500 [Plakobranchus ocellatus]